MMEALIMFAQTTNVAILGDILYGLKVEATSSIAVQIEATLCKGCQGVVLFAKASLSVRATTPNSPKREAFKEKDYLLL